MRGMAHGMIGDGRALRVCDACGGVDDHPRHAILGAPDQFAAPDPELVETVLANIEALGEAAAPARGRLLRDLMSLATVDLHMDCCRARGCPTGACDQVTAGAEDARGADLLAHVAALPSTVTEPADAGSNGGQPR